MKVVLNSKEITNQLSKVTIQEGTRNSGAQILKLYYKDGKVETKVSLPFDLHKTHVIVKRHE